MLFFVLREASRLRDREGIRGAALDTAVANLLGKVLPLVERSGATTSIRNLATLSAAARRDWPHRDWQSIPAEWFSPGPDKAEAKYLSQVSSAVSHGRDVHMTKLFGTAAREGERAFAVVGRNHVPMISAALDCMMRRQGKLARHRVRTMQPVSRRQLVRRPFC